MMTAHRLAHVRCVPSKELLGGAHENEYDDGKDDADEADRHRRSRGHRSGRQTHLSERG